MNSNLTYAKNGGDDAGNGGFAYKQSDKILKMATTSLQEKITNSSLDVLVKNPSWRGTLFSTLKYENLQKLYKKNASRGGKLLAMDYVVNPPSVKILKPYYVAFMGRTEGELLESSLEVQKRLLHEASHIWGYKEEESEKFAADFLDNVGNSSKRVSGDISFKSDMCSCLNGKSDMINDCNDFCSTKPNTHKPTLYLTAILGSEVLKNPKIKTIYDWCTVSLDSETTNPQCNLVAWDGAYTIDLAVDIDKNSNTIRADITPLNYNRTYIIKIVESKTGNNAETRAVQIRRVKENIPTLGPIKIAPISQYTCLNYSGIIDSNGNIDRTDFTKYYYYFPMQEVPQPMPPAGRGNPSMTICHDEFLHPGNDSVLYPRLELIPTQFALWDKADPGFVSDGKKLNIHKEIDERMLNQGIGINVNLFFDFNYSTRPNTKNSLQGFAMVPWSDKFTGKSFCPTNDQYNSPDRLFTILKDYIGETEGLYIAESEPDNVGLHSSLLINESLLKMAAFTIADGLKVRTSDFHHRAIFFYWPYNPATDPLVAGNRKLFHIKSIDELNAPLPFHSKFSAITSDKKIGCIPKLMPPPPTNGGRTVGENCVSDYECSSFCCNHSSASCQPHDGKKIFCEKSYGQSCVIDIFCAKEYVSECRVFKTGSYKADGTTPVCSLRCQPVEKFGYCGDNICQPARSLPIPSQDDVDNCKGAI